MSKFEYIMKKLFWFIVFSYLSIGFVHAQLTVQNGLNAQQLANILAGPDITPFNAVVFDTFSYQTGSFNYIGNDLGLNNGIILSTGDVMAAIGPNSASNTTSGTQSASSSDSLLSSIANRGISDLTFLEFEFEAPSDEISFNYIFLSEDYNEFIFRAFNDAFAFTISGPGIIGEENLALIPNANLPITTSNVNNNLNWQYYVDNDSGTVNIEYDGFTTLLTARKTGLQPCGVYKLSLRIADGSHQLLDSGVMIEANSLRSNSIAAVANTYSTDTTALEGCIPARYTFDLGFPTSQDLNIPIRLGGTALNGVDYELIDSIITIPAGQSSSTIIINALSDGLVEGQETIELYYRRSTSFCIPEDTIRMYIDDATPLSYTTTGTNLSCNGDQSGSIMLNISGGSAPYSVNYSDITTGIYKSIPAANLPISNLGAATYALQVYDQYGCTADAIVSGGLFNAGQTFLPDGTGVSYTNDITITGFNGGQNLSSINQINSICATLEHSYAGDLGIELIAPNGASIQLKGVGNTGSGVYTCNLGEPVASGPTDAWSTSNLTAGVGYQYCWTPTPTYPSMTDMISPTSPGPPPSHTYTTLAGNTYTDFYLPAGSYTPKQSLFGLIGTPLNGNWQLKVTDYYAQDNGYLFNWSISLNAALPDSIITLTEPTAPLITTSTTLPNCGLSDGNINLSVSGLFPPYNYLWNTGATTKDLSAVPAGIYTVTVTDNNNCPFEHIVNLSNTGTPVPSAIISPESCTNAANGSINLNIGTGIFNYVWSNGMNTQNISNLAPNLYSVTIDDGANCFGYATYTIDPAITLNLTSSILHENCGDREGEIELSIMGGVTPYQFVWSNGSSNQKITDLQQGNYYVTVTDANGCILVDTFNVINLVGDCVPSCDLSITNTNLTHENCGNEMGSIDISTYSTGGSIFYHWSNGATTEDVSNLTVGNYNLTVEDARGCTLYQSYSILNQTNGLNFSEIVVDNEFCNDSSGQLTPIVYGGVQPYSFIWSNGSTNRNLSGLTSGNYTCTVTDATGCSTHLTTFLDNLADFSLLYSNVLDATCNDSTGSIDILLPLGFDYRFIWSNGATTEDLRAVPSGTYTCTITDDDTGCKLVTPSYTVNNQPGSLTFDYIDIDHQICSNGLGDIVLMVSGGTPPYTYNWNTGATTPSIDSLLTGIYEATIADSTGCSIHTGLLNIGNTNSNLVIDAINIFDESCNNQLGAINLQVSGNSGALSFLWNTGSNSQNISNLSAGTYTCTISDTSGCTDYITAQVSNHSGSLAVANTLVTHESCSQSNGTLDLVLTGGSMPLSYQWSNSATTQNLNNLANGMYVCTITDANGCQVVDSVIIQNNTGSLSATLSGLTNEICDDNSGSITLSANSTNLSLNYLWSNGDTTKNIHNLTSGNYTCTITDSNNCRLVLGPYTINNSSSIIDSCTIIDESCNAQNGSIDLSVSGGISPYTYLWSNGSITEDLFGLAEGTYSCTITDASGCQQIITKEVHGNSGSLSILNSQITDELCTNSQGAINLTIVGGTAPITYQWSNGSITEDINNLNNGNYTVTISDANNCILTSNYTVTNNSGNFQISSPNVIDEECGDNQGSITINLINGLAPYTYQWSNGASTQNLSNLSAGIYTQTITDDNNCIIIHSVQVQNTASNLFVVTDSVVDATCNNANGSINISIIGGLAPYTYQWSNGDTTQNLNNLNAGLYTCQITDQNGCSINYSNQVKNLGGNLHIANMATIDDNCQHGNGAIFASIAGGDAPYSFTWGTTVPNPCGYYTLNLYSSNPMGWAGPTLIKIYINGRYYSSYTIPLDPYYGTTGSSNFFRTARFLVCQGDSIRLVLEGPGSPIYELLDGQGNIVFAKRYTSNFVQSDYAGVVNSFFQGQGTNYLSGLTGGNYSLTVTDTNGCSTSQSVYLNTQSDSLAISSNLTDESCGQQDGQIDLSVQGGINPSYAWSNGLTTEDLNNLSEGAYSVTVSDNYGCLTTDTYFVFNNANGLEVIDTIITMDSCLTSQGTINLTVTGGQAPYSFEWSNGSLAKDIVGISAGTYTITITDFSGCKRVEQYSVGNNNGIVVTSNPTNIACSTNLGAIDLSVTGGLPPYVYNWSNGDTTQDISNLTAGNYTCTITDATGCVTLWQDTIHQLPSPLFVSNVAMIKKPCNIFTIGVGGDIYVAIGGGTAPYSYVWSDGSTNPDLIDVPNGFYSVTVTDTLGCQLVDTFHLEVLEPLYISDTTITPDLCNNGQGAIDLTFLGNGGRTYLWNTGATTQNISNLSAGNYTLTISFSGNGITVCEREVRLNVPSSSGTLSLDTLTFSDETCTQSNGSIDLTLSGGTGNYTYNWSNGDTTQDLSNLAAGLYTVTITDSIGCAINSSSININNLSYGLGISGAFLTDEQCGLDGQVVIVPSGGQMPYTYNWSNGDTTQDLNNVSGGVYYLTLTEANGCQIIDSFTVNSSQNALTIGTQLIQPSCGLSNGGIDLMVNGGATPYNYQWSNGNTTSSILGLSIGNYTVTISDANGCVVPYTFTLADNSSFVNLLSVDTMSTSCNSCNDGSIDLNLGTLGAPYTFLWDNGSTTEDLNNLTAGTYFVTITNSDGCTLDTSFVVSTSVGIERIPSQINAKVYPNPSEGEFTIEFSSPLTEKATIHIYNNLGQIIYTRRLEEMDLDQIIHLQLQDIVSGVYLLQLTSEQKYFTQKIIIH